MLSTRFVLATAAMFTITAISALVTGVLAPATAPAVACGSTPGFCPNPPTSGQTHTVTQDGTVGTGQDF
jgi:hypothetical protein